MLGSQHWHLHVLGSIEQRHLKPYRGNEVRGINLKLGQLRVSPDPGQKNLKRLRSKSLFEELLLLIYKGGVCGWGKTANKRLLWFIHYSDLVDTAIWILLYGCTTWTLTKRLEKKLDGNYTRMLRAILNKSWQQHPTWHQLYGHLPSITKTIQARRTRHAGHCWRSKDELISDVLQKQDDQLEHTYSSYVRIRDVALKTCQKRWTIGRSGERGSGISMLAARHDDDDDDDEDDDSLW